MKKSGVCLFLWLIIGFTNYLHAQCAYTAPFTGNGTQLTNGYFIYPDYLFSAVGSTVTISWVSSNNPNKFTLVDPSGASVTSNWVGVVTWPGPWGASLNTATTGTLTLTVPCGTPPGCWKLTIETVVNNTIAPNLTDDYSFSASSTGSALLPVIITASPTQLCPGDSAVLTASGASSFVWSTTQTSNSITVAPTATTTYSVTGTNPNGCTGTSNVSITVALPAVAISPVSICNGQSGTLTAIATPSGGTYLWSSGATDSTLTASPATTTTYTVTYTSLGGCTKTATGTITVNTSTPPTVSVNPVSICGGSSGTLTTYVSPSGGSYTWSAGGGNAPSMTASPASTTTYSVTYTALNGCSSTGTGTITIKPLPNVSVDSATLCNGGSATLTATVAPMGGVFLWSNGGGSGPSTTDNPIATTTYMVTYTSLNGCSATGTGIISVNNVTVTANTVTACNGGSGTITAIPTPVGGTFSWTPGSSTNSSITETPGTTTTYTVTYTAVSGCTATATGTIVVAPAPSIIVNPVSVCVGQSATLNANTFPSGGTYFWSPGGATGQNITVSPAVTTAYTVTYTALNGCINTATGTITVKPKPTVTVNSTTICNGQPVLLTANGATNYFWSSGGTNSTELVTPIVTTTYTVTGITAGCSNTALSTVTVQANLGATINQNICNGNSYFFNGQNLSTAGAYKDTLVSFHGCDSVISLNLTIAPYLTGSTNQTICTGNSYLFNGQNLSISGPYKDTVSTIAGCDSIVTLNLTVTPPLTGAINKTICTGNAYLFNGQNLTVSGTYKDTVSTTLGCDSIITLNLTVNTSTGTVNQSICTGNSYYFNGQNLSVSGAYKDTLSTTSGCDSIVTLNLAVNAITGTINQSICAGNSYFFNGQNLSVSGAYNDTLPTTSGCDSIVTLNLTVNTITGTINQSICTGNSYLFNGQNLTISGAYKDTLSTTSGCDSIVTLNLTVNTITGTINQSICAGNFYFFNGQNLSVSGAYNDTLPTTSGCDSIVTLNLTVSTITGSFNQVICTGSTYLFNTQTLSVSGAYKDTVSTTSGCDSIVTLNLIVSPSLTGSFNQSICAGSSYLFNGQNLINSGLYNDTLTTTSNCDSIVTLNLIVHPNASTIISQTICTGNFYSFNGQNLTNSGSYLDTLGTIFGCDSLITLNLTVNPTTSGTINQSICFGDSYLFNSQNISTPGLYLDTLTSVLNCDSIVTLNLTVGNSITGTINQSICTGNFYLFNGQNLINSGSYLDTLNSFSGCDSIVSLSLTVTPALTGTITQTICTGNFYPFNGQNIISSGTYFDTLSTTSSCDSIVTLNLTVNTITGSYNNTICRGSSYLFNGQYLTATGSYLDTIATTTGCDSIVTLNLTVNTLTSSYNHIICPGASYSFNGQSLTNPGTYFDTLTTVSGCDSVVTLNLSISQNITGTINQIVCLGGSYFFNGQTITTTGSYKDTLNSSMGCDSIVTLNLSFAPSVTGTIVQTICPGTSYLFNGQNLTVTGSYRDTLVATGGCDSILTLILIVTTTQTGTISKTICNGNFYSFNGQNLTNTGVYLDTLTASSGCDSVLSLILVVSPPPITGVSSDVTINIGEATTLIVSGTGVYNWSPSVGLNTDVGNIVSASPTETTIYCVTINSNDCIDTACITVTVEDNCPKSDSVLSAPNAFSPNNDGLNDEYCLQGWNECAKEFSFGIYNRWGEEVFKSETPNFCWDGKYKGKPLDPQVLVYYIKARFSNLENQVLRSGNISLMK